jgi:hypothetical protein
MRQEDRRATKREGLQEGGSSRVPHPGCFVRVANKGVMVDAASRKEKSVKIEGSKVNEQRAKGDKRKLRVESRKAQR